MNKQGYFYIQVKKEKKIFTLKIHRLVAENFLEKPNQDLILFCSKVHHGKVCVNHKDGNKQNNDVNNLEWCSHIENNLHAKNNNLIPVLYGVKNGRSVLTEQTVNIVCRMFENGASIQEVVDACNVSRAQASKIRCGIAWKHISCNYNIKPKRKRTKNLND